MTNELFYGYKKTAGVSLMILGAVMATWGGLMLHWGSVSDQWPSAPGHIVEARIVESHDSHSSSTSYTPTVKYTYRVDGERYEADRLGFCTWGTRRRAEAVATLNPYVPNSSVDVHYHPDHPQIAVLQPGAPAKGWIWPLIGANAFLFGAALLIHGFRSDQSRARPEYALADSDAPAYLNAEGAPETEPQEVFRAE
jgi:hypothetical protein